MKEMYENTCFARFSDLIIPEKISGNRTSSPSHKLSLDLRRLCRVLLKHLLYLRGGVSALCENGLRDGLRIRTAHQRGHYVPKLVKLCHEIRIKRGLL